MRARMFRSSMICLLEAWMARQVPDEILADGLEEYGLPKLAKRLRCMQKYTGARRKRIESRLTRDLIYRLPSMRRDDFLESKGHVALGEPEDQKGGK